jgi:hypothetical protein
MACTSILRIGGPPGSETVISIIKNHLSNHFPSQSDKLQITNKYFTADVQFLAFHEQHEQEQTLNLKEDGILIIFPSDAHIDSLTQIHDELPQDQIGDTLRLCISTSAKSITVITKEYEDRYSQRVLWCLDRGYEYVEVDVTEKGLTDGFDEREKDGFARVVEAMGGTVWSSAIMAAKNRTVAQTLLDHCEDEVGTKEVKVEAADSTNDEPMVNGKECERQKTSEVSDEAKDESVLNNIEDVMKQAKTIREASKGGQLSDQERQSRAGNAAEMLMGLLDQMGFDDDEDDGSSEDE